MSTRQQIIFWAVVLAILTSLFSRSLSSVAISFYFVCFLLPVVVGTSFFFNEYLVPKYLLKGFRWKFTLYFVYLLVVSIYLEMLVMILAFVILADYQIENLGKIVSDIYLMAVILYLVVLSNGFVSAMKSLGLQRERISELEQSQERDKAEYLLVRVERKNAQIKIKEITFIESLSDYLKIHTTSGIQITKEKISAVEKSLPTRFIRIHRSFIVNRDYIRSFNRETIELSDHKLSIGRKYKKSVSQILGS